MSLTVNQHTNLHGFPKAAELIEIAGAHALEASDRAIFNQLLQIVHDSDRLVERTRNGRSRWHLFAKRLRNTRAMTA
jgi:hypothetical protein